MSRVTLTGVGLSLLEYSHWVRIGEGQQLLAYGLAVREHDPEGTFSREERVQSVEVFVGVLLPLGVDVKVVEVLAER